MNEIKKKIMDAVISQFNIKGMKFTMDDISKELHISKKTIYKEFNDKDELFFATVDYGFSAIKEKEAEIVADDSLELLEKIEKLIVCLPDNYKNIDFRRVYQLREKFPDVYKKIAERVESDWGETERLLEQAMDEGLIKRMPIAFIKLIIEGAIEKFLSSKELSNTGYSYEESLNEMINIVMNGLILPQGEDK
ncbi:transcriptional regulator, TetR family [Butyrivibrio proteoclasticus]|uniref:Transcriptional regulator, TetR family n=1 Tax=Butyrivibrio proteoclasticus TaxID=43305 RepID=A0A1I5UV11_9FIRM|nr:TetR/AcrR family transcriptional regulator [Butyrivibrio proteoclasticus]SFP99049.1 transcriptional regulator, TetR family [Butyrivibrio proteoclasticus]